MKHGYMLRWLYKEGLMGLRNLVGGGGGVDWGLGVVKGIPGIKLGLSLLVWRKRILIRPIKVVWNEPRRMHEDLRGTGLGIL